MIDAHCHLNDAAYPREEIKAIISRAKEAGVVNMVCCGAGVESSRRAVAIAEEFDEVWATVGIHPEEMAEMKKWGSAEVKKRLLELTSNRQVVAIGEAGLDYTRQTTDTEKQTQKDLFKINLELSQETGLPLVVHCRNAFEDVYQKLVGGTGGVQMHCFTGDWEWAKKFLDLGCYLSFGGIVTYKSGEEVREVIKRMPEEKLLIETDAPYLAPEPVRGSRNEPKNVKIVAEAVAELRGSSFNRIGELTARNAMRLFRK